MLLGMQLYIRSRGCGSRRAPAHTSLLLQSSCSCAGWFCAGETAAVYLCPCRLGDNYTEICCKGPLWFLVSCHFWKRDARPDKRDQSVLLYLRNEPLRISNVEKLAGRDTSGQWMRSSLCFPQSVIKSTINIQSKTCSGWNVDLWK